MNAEEKLRKHGSENESLQKSVFCFPDRSFFHIQSDEFGLRWSRLRMSRQKVFESFSSAFMGVFPRGFNGFDKFSAISEISQDE